MRGLFFLIAIALANVGFAFSDQGFDDASDGGGGGWGVIVVCGLFFLYQHLKNK